jgi:hypothetical protein
MLVGGVALAQQGLIVEPWRRAPAPASAPVRATPMRGMPGSGLAPVSVVPVVRPKVAALPTRIADPLKWSPPVVELLVDPWARGPVAAPAPRPARRLDWVPTSVDRTDIVDPWADAAPQGRPRVASHPAGARHSTIF